MSLKLRNILVLLIGTVLGLTGSLGSTVFAEREVADRAAVADPGLSPEYIELLTRVVERVRREYVDPIDEQRIVENAIRGILSDLDPHSKYLPPDDYEEMRISTTGNYSGIGLDVKVDGDKVIVVTPLEGAPAAEAGILPGDVLLAVDGVPVDHDHLESTVSRMRGKSGTVVRLTVQRDGFPEPLEFALTRADIHVQTVRAELVDGRIGYFRITSFANTTDDDLEAAALELERQVPGGLDGMVLDLRNNPGGVLEAAVDVADLFLAEGLIVRGSGRARQARFERYAGDGDLLEDVPLVVVVNGGSASASEIVAGALKDHGRALLVGTKTYGKGSVQTVMPIGDNRAIKLTTSRYITPSGAEINGIGIEPDIVVNATGSRRIYMGTGGTSAMLEDAQLSEALRTIGYSQPLPEPATTTAAAASPGH
ncbi:MAG TPA: S41 family peptidase [Gammaproteobacteria bacterium]